MVGIPDGLGAFDNGDGSFTVLMNQELVPGDGVARAHGADGAFVSSLTIDKATLQVTEAHDLIQHVYLYNTGTHSYDLSDPVAFILGCAEHMARDAKSITKCINGARTIVEG
jgi:hypothetical protein